MTVPLGALRLSIVAVALLTTVTVACGSLVGTPDLPDPAGPPVVTASGEDDGVKLRLDLDHRSLTPGQVMWASLTIENTNDHPISWIGGACAEPGRVVVTTAAIGDYGRGWTEYALADLKKRLVHTAPPGFVPLLDQHRWERRSEGVPACVNEIRSFDLAAHATLRSRFAWDGMLAGAPAPSGPVGIQADLSMNDNVHMTGRAVGATTTLELTGGSPLRVSPGRAIDAAFEDGRLARWIMARTAPDSSGRAAAYGLEGTMRLDDRTWLITVFVKAGASAGGTSAGQITVRVDAQTGAVAAMTP